MAALHNRIVAGDYEFKNDDIISMPTNESVSLLGDELSYDTFEPVVKFEKATTGPVIFQPKENGTPCIAFNGNNHIQTSLIPKVNNRKYNIDIEIRFKWNEIPDIVIGSGTKYSIFGSSHGDDGFCVYITDFIGRAMYRADYGQSGGALFYDYNSSPREFVTLDLNPHTIRFVGTTNSIDSPGDIYFDGKLSNRLGGASFSYNELPNMFIGAVHRLGSAGYADNAFQYGNISVYYFKIRELVDGIWYERYDALPYDGLDSHGDPFGGFLNQIDQNYIYALESYDPLVYYLDSEYESSWYDGLETDDNYILSGWFKGSIGDLRTLPYGTVVTHYHNNNLIGKYYLSKIIRNSANEYELRCISAIGLLDRQKHKGNIYFGASFSAVLSEIMQNLNVNYTVSNELNSLKIYGWLPYDIARNNLQRLLFATNAHIDKDINGDPIFKYLSIAQSTINDVKVYNEGKEEYPELASKAIITEHSFFFIGSEEEVELFNTGSDSYTDDLEVVFSNAPIYIDSIRQEGNITFISKSVNYVVIRGNGIIYGKPYTHTELNIVRTANVGNEEKEVSVSDVCLITTANSENVADRIMDYYSSQVKIEAGIVYSGEKCGNKYSFNDSFKEHNIGFLTKMKKIVSSFIKAECEFITGYNPIQNGNNFSTCVRLIGSGTWSKPSGINRIRVVLIGGGDGGDSGTRGADGGSEYDYMGGAGGFGGAPGLGGKIYIQTIDSPNNSYSYSCGRGGYGGYACYDVGEENFNPGTAGNPTTFGDYSSASGRSYENGYVDIFNNEIYALSGLEGYDGGDGGNGGMGGGPGSDGQGVELSDGTIIDGGKGGASISFETTFLQSTYHEGGGGAGGASATGSGANGQDATRTQSIDTHELIEEYNIVYEGSGGNGSSPTQPSTPTMYGKGGDGGHGGGGGGGKGCLNDGTMETDDTYVFVMSYHSSVNGSGGIGGAGGNGAPGCILIYY